MVRVWSKIPNAPKIVPWVDVQDNNDMITYFDQMLQANPQIQFIYQGKPLILANMLSATSPSRIAALANRYTVRLMGGLVPAAQMAAGAWSFLQPCQPSFKAAGGNIPCQQAMGFANGSPEQVSVTAAYQLDYISNSADAVPKFHGLTLLRQMQTAFQNPDAPIVTITGWNEWMAQRFCADGTTSCSANGDHFADGHKVFVDQYDAEYSRDLEPGGGMGAYYYNLLYASVALLKSGQDPMGALSVVPYGAYDYYLDPAVFDWQDYTSRYGDLSQLDEIGAIQHWIAYGTREGRIGKYSFYPTEYLQMNKDVANAIGANNYAGAMSHFIVNGYNEGRAGRLALRPEVFNWQWYIQHQSDLFSIFGPNNQEMATKHWLQSGLYEGRTASPSFSTVDYFSLNPDVAQACGAQNYLCAVSHYITYGINEHRSSINVAYPSSVSTFISAGSNDELWPSSQVLDRNPDSVYSSSFFPTSQNDRGTFLAAWFAGPTSISEIDLTARKENATRSQGFPIAYNVFITSPDNSHWIFMGNFTNQPDASGIARVGLGQTYSTCAVMIIPTVLDTDMFGQGHYFQISDMVGVN